MYHLKKELKSEDSCIVHIVKNGGQVQFAGLAGLVVVDETEPVSHIHGETPSSSVGRIGGDIQSSADENGATNVAINGMSGVIANAANVAALNGAANNGTTNLKISFMLEFQSYLLLKLMLVLRFDVSPNKSLT